MGLHSTLRRLHVGSVLIMATAITVASCGSRGGSPNASGSSAPTGSNAARPAGGSATTVANAALNAPTDACSLLTLDQVRTLIPDASAGESRTASAAAAKASDCFYRSAAGTDSLTVGLQNTSVPADQMKPALQGEDGAQALSGIGDFATVIPTSIDVEVKALFGQSLFRVDLNGENALARKDKVIALARQAAAHV